MKIGFQITKEANIKLLLDEILETDFPSFKSYEDYKVFNNQYLVDSTDNDNVAIYKILNFDERESLDQFSITLRSIDKYQKHIAGCTVKKEFEGDKVFIMKYNFDGREIFAENQKAERAMIWLIDNHLS